jgi:hypothetical protein
VGTNIPVNTVWPGDVAAILAGQTTLPYVVLITTEYRVRRYAL